MPSLLTRGQKRLLSLLLALGLYILANSAYLVVSQPREEVLPVFYQVMLLSHLAVGGLLLVLATVFIFWHLKRVKALWHRSAAASGGGLALAVYLLFASGIFILSEANSLQHRWIFWSHRILAVLAPAVYVTHRLVSHFRPAPRALARAGLVFAGLLLLMVGFHHSTLPDDPIRVWEAGGETYAAAGDPFIPFEPDNYPDPSSPFWPSRTTTDSGNYFPARIITRNERGDFERIRADVERLGFAATTALGAQTCARCHAEIVAQWKRSAHRFASFNNPLYRASVERFRKERGKKASQWCAGCHDPAIMLAGNMEKEIDPLTPESQAGLTCLACHAIESIHGIEGNGGYHIADERPSPYLFDTDSSGLGRATADLLIKSKPTVHKRQMLKPFFRDPVFCSACHKVSLDVPVNGYRYLRGQDEFDASLSSGVAHGSAGTFYLPDQPKNCQECHMPRVEARLPDVSAKAGKVRSHLFLAVNDALPFLRGDHEMREQIYAFLRDRKLRIDVFALQRTRDGARVLALDRAKPVLVAGEEVVFEVVVRNVGVGHTFPGGTNDSNEAWVELTIS
ncbi:MAG: multiheme c-type cytochrome, partial [Planctomycetota bacterium]